MKKPRTPLNRIYVYLTAEELMAMREAAAKRKLTVSRYARDLMIDASELQDERAQKIPRMLAAFGGELRTIMAMIDRFAGLTATPEDYAAWQRAVEAAIRPNGNGSGRNG
jgi:hypothetical protein